MSREPDLEELAVAVEHARHRPLKVRLATWALRKLSGPIGGALAVSVSVTVGLSLIGVDPGWVLMAMFYGSPLILGGVVMFVAHAWGQNRGLTYNEADGQAGTAEPGRVGQPWAANADGQGMARPAPGHVARTGPPTTVTATVLPWPVEPTAELPQASGQTQPIRYPAREEEPDA